MNIYFNLEPNTVATITQNNTGKRILSELDRKKDEEGGQDNIIKKLKLDKLDKKDYTITETDTNSTNVPHLNKLILYDLFSILCKKLRKIKNSDINYSLHWTDLLHLRVQISYLPMKQSIEC